LAGVILASQFGAGQPTEGVGWELFAIASVVVGGTLLTGGSGSVGATLAGALLLAMVHLRLSKADLHPELHVCPPMQPTQIPNAPCTLRNVRNRTVANIDRARCISRPRNRVTATNTGDSRCILTNGLL
jgi:hypothetical protein